MGDTVHGDKYGGDRVHGNKVVHSGASGGVGPGGRWGRPSRATILLLSANPDGRQPLRLDEERREIDRAVALAQARDRLDIRTADAVRLGDLQEALLRHRPAIAHFSGHGSASTGIVVTDAFGDARPVPPDALQDLFRILRGGLRCVVLNACHTDEQAEAIAAHVPCVIGMHSRVLDDAAICFAAAFYLGIAQAMPIGTSFELGCNQMRLHGFADADLPRLKAAPGAANRPVIAELPRDG